MVRQGKTAGKLARRSIRAKKGRYLAILFIVLLSVGFLSGLKVTREQMWDAAERYLDSQNMYDYRVYSTLGFTGENIQSLSKVFGMETAEGGKSVDALLVFDGTAEDCLCISLPEKVNVPSLTAGRMPGKETECLADHRAFSEEDLGKTIAVSSDNDDDTKAALSHDTYTIVGLVNSPLYLSADRGSAESGTGERKGFLYLPKENFTSEYYTEADLVLEGSLKAGEAGEIFSNAYDSLVDDHEAAVKTAARDLAAARYEDILSDIQKEADDKKQTALDELGDKAQEMKDSLADQVESQVAEAKTQLDAAVSAGMMSEDQEKAQLADIRSKAEDAVDAKFQNLSVADFADMAGMSKEDAENLKDLLGKDTIGSLDDLIDQKAIPMTREEAVSAAEDNGVEEPETYVLTRKENAGYVSFESDTSIIHSIADIFPLFFILIALLVCVTTMLRMVEEERSQIGTLKALGYSGSAIAGKYLRYAGSAALLGWVLGFFPGTYFIPRGFWTAYATLYDFTGLRYRFDGMLALVTLLMSLLSIGLGTLAACVRALRETAASLIRPRSAKPGKRILLERIPPLWRRLSFLKKATLRNMFRYKIRMVMMLVGIGCSSALIVTAFGVRDSMIDIGSQQYEGVQTYQLECTIDEDKANLEDLKRSVLSEDGVTAVLPAVSRTVDVSSDTASMSAVTVYAFAEDADLSGFWNLWEADSGKKCSLPKEGTVLVSKRLAQKLSLREGTEFTVSGEDGKKLRTGETFRNYIGNFLLMTEKTRKACFGREKANVLLVCTKALSGAKEKALCEKLGEISGITGILRLSESRQKVDRSVSCLNVIIWLIVAFAGALSFIVTFNLTNINLAERSREIATVEVLGFYPKEVRFYCLRENLVLSVLAGVLGMPLGYLFTHAVMSRILLDNMTYSITIRSVSYVLSLTCTALFAVIVNIFMRRQIRKINMAESLKAVE